jgi:YgiT-type zinc finger domain-containing protein
MARLTKCIECGSTKLVIRKKDFTFEVKNPGTIKIKNLECCNCGESYFDDKEVTEISRKINRKLK